MKKTYIKNEIITKSNIHSLHILPHEIESFLEEVNAKILNKKSKLYNIFYPDDFYVHYVTACMLRRKIKFKDFLSFIREIEKRTGQLTMKQKSALAKIYNKWQK